MIMILKKSSAMLLTLIFIIIGLMSGVVVRYIPYMTATRFVMPSSTSVIVDAGHGAPDGGAVGISGVLEKDVNLAIAQKLKEVLEGKGITVIMTRESDRALYDESAETIREKKRSDMNKRLEIMKESDAGLFISIHMNSFPNKSVKGLHVFYSKNHEKIKPLAENIQAHMGNVTGADMHVVKAADKDLFLMKNPPLPSILVECGFLSNPDEEKKLTTDDYQAKIAWAIADAVDDYFNGDENT